MDVSFYPAACTHALNGEQQPDVIVVTLMWTECLIIVVFFVFGFERIVGHQAIYSKAHVLKS